VSRRTNIGPCSVAVCTREQEDGGLCHSHYEYRRRTGKTPTHKLLTDIPFEERFWARTVPGDNGCIIWTAAKASEGRYGMCSWQGKVRPAHVVAYLAFVGEYDQSLDLDHLCRVTLCVNPLHLEPVTHHENILRGRSLQAENARKTHCIRGHDLTDESNIRRIGPGLRGRACRACARLRDAARLRQRHDEGRCSGDRRCSFCAPGIPAHGRISTYRHGGCRCDECSEAQRRYMSEYKLRVSA
jgi:hypothetical protein